MYCDHCDVKVSCNPVSPAQVPARIKWPTIARITHAVTWSWRALEPVTLGIKHDYPEKLFTDDVKYVATSKTGFQNRVCTRLPLIAGSSHNHMIRNCPTTRQETFNDGYNHFILKLVGLPNYKSLPAWCIHLTIINAWSVQAREYPWRANFNYQSAVARLKILASLNRSFKTRRRKKKQNCFSWILVYCTLIYRDTNFRVLTSIS